MAALIICPCVAGAAQSKAVDISDKSGVKHAFLACDYSQNKDFIVGSDGKVLWEYDLPVPQDGWVLPSGNLLLSNIRGVQEVTRGKKIVWEYKSPDGTEIHNCQPLPNGRVLIAENGTKRIIEVDRAGVIRKELKIDTITPDTHMHFRMARKLANGNYLIAFVGEHVVREFNTDGEIVREIKTPGDCYSAVRLPNGNTLIGCGDGHKVIEVDPKDKIVWSLEENDIPGIPLRFAAGVQRLPNGNTTVCNWGGHGHIGKQPLIFEITRDKKVVWKVDDHKTFRAISSMFLMDGQSGIIR